MKLEHSLTPSTKLNVSSDSRGVFLMSHDSRDKESDNKAQWRSVIPARDTFHFQRFFRDQLYLLAENESCFKVEEEILS